MKFSIDQFLGIVEQYSEERENMSERSGGELARSMRMRGEAVRLIVSKLRQNDNLSAREWAILLSYSTQIHAGHFEKLDDIASMRDVGEIEETDLDRIDIATGGA